MAGTLVCPSFLSLSAAAAAGLGCSDIGRTNSLDVPEATAMIERSQHEGILTLRLAHGKVSAIDVELLDALLRELDGAADDVRALILTGTGSIFSAGVD